MARTDRKPVYIFHAEHALGVWCGAAEDADLHERMFHLTPSQSRDLRWGRYDSALPEDIDYSTEPAAFISDDRVRGSVPAQRVAREAVDSVYSRNSIVVGGNRAAVLMLGHVVRYRRGQGRVDDPVKARDGAGDTLHLCAQDAGQHAPTMAVIAQGLLSNQTAVSATAMAVEFRTNVMRPPPQAVFRNSIAVGRSDMALLRGQSDSAASDRFLWEDNYLNNWGFRVAYMGGIWVCERDGTAHLLTRDGRDALCQMVLGWSNALLTGSATHEMEIGTPNRAPSVHSIERIMGDMISAACRNIREGRSHTTIAKACGRMLFAEFQEAPEGDETWDSNGRIRAKDLRDSAAALWPSVGVTANYMKDWDLQTRMELWKLGNVLVSDDSSPIEMKKRIDALSTKGRSVEPGEWSAFVQYVKRRDLADEIYRTKVVPPTRGDPVDAEWAASVMEGKWCLPPKGMKTEMFACWEFEEIATDFWMDAQDVTWVAPDGKGGIRVGNELAAAWENGPLLDGRRTVREAAPLIPEEKCHIYWATKAENTKDPSKQRLTASADAVARAVLSNLDHAERSQSKSAPGFAQGISRIAFQEKIQKILDHCSSNPSAFVSSHDVAGWSEFEDRDAKLEYMAYECAKFKFEDWLDATIPWKHMISHVQRSAMCHTTEFISGGVQGFSGALDSLLHGKIVSYIHWKLGVRDLVNFKANCLCCIDDVSYDTTLSGRDQALGPVRKEIRETYSALGYPIDEMKTIEGKRKLIFLSEAYWNKALINMPLKVAVKFYVEEKAAVRSVHEDCASIMSSFSAFMKAGGHPLVAYSCGLYFVYLFLRKKGFAMMRASLPEISVWAVAPMAEGGLGLPTLRNFLLGADPDAHYSWRSTVVTAAERGNLTGNAWLRALAGIRSLTIRTGEIPQLMRDPYSIVRDFPKPSIMMRKGLIEDALWATNHAKEWDEFRKRGGEFDRAIEEAIRSGSMCVDLLTAKDIMEASPGAPLEGILARFCSSKAVKSICKHKRVVRIARSCARADRKWGEFMLATMRCGADDRGETQQTMALDDRAGRWGAVDTINTIIPCARHALCIGAWEDSFSEDHQIAFEPSRLSKKNISGRLHNQAAISGPVAGIKTSGVTWDSVGKAMNKRPLWKGIIRYAAVARSMENLGVDMSAVGHIVAAAWDLDYDPAHLAVHDGSASVKRMAQATAQNTHSALGLISCLGAASASATPYFSGISALMEHALVDPVEIAWTARNLAALAGMTAFLGIPARIKWAGTLAADVDLSLRVTPTAYAWGDYTPFSKDMSAEGPTSVRIANVLRMDEGAFSVVAPVSAPAIIRAPIYERARTGPEIGEKTIRLKKVKGPALSDNHAKNVIASKIVEARILEVAKGQRIRIAPYIGFSPGDPDAPLPSSDWVLNEHMWGLIFGDCESEGLVADGSLLRSLVYLTGGGIKAASTVNQVMSHLGNFPLERITLIVRSQESTVGASTRAFRCDPPLLIISSTPDADNRRERQRRLRTRNIILSDSYKKRAEGARSASVAGYMSGRLAARVCIAADINLEFRVEVAALERFFSQRLGRQWSAAFVSRAGDDSFADLVTHSRTCAAAGWDTDAFESGVMNEKKYMVPDRDDIKKREFYLSRKSISDPARRWVAQPEEAAPAQGGSLASLMAMALRSVNMAPTIDLSTLNLEEGSDDDSDYEGDPFA